ncbi:hypothetical protein [Nocardia tengchongensis]|uniref:hypothetical protein n=1 Tax=Nocardia tengchongensis TaxID=2055889 RepID=UPI0036C988B8
MSRRGSRPHDRLADRVANSFLSEDLERAAALIPILHRWSIYFLEPGREPQRRFAAEYSAARTDEKLTAGLLEYLGGQLSGVRCRGCGFPLPATPKRAGRPRQHCDNTCRQLAYRNRKRLAEHHVTTTRVHKIDWNLMDWNNIHVTEAEPF